MIWRENMCTNCCNPSKSFVECMKETGIKLGLHYYTIVQHHSIYHVPDNAKLVIIQSKIFDDSGMEDIARGTRFSRLRRQTRGD